MPLQRSLDNRYEVRESLGRGGMAEVYLARDRVLERNVALKVLNGYYAEDEEFVRRFRREARSAASLAHPNVVSIHDLGEAPGSGGEPTTYYIAMEYVNGVSLRGLLEREGRLSVADTVAVARQVAEGLGAAHARGIVHRDIKPHNILLSGSGAEGTPGGSRGEVKVADFGIARAAGSEAVTGTGEVLGTAHYLSPEQVMGGEATPQSDLYSLGVVMYEALTGSRPYDADHPFGVAMQHVTGDLVPPKRLLPELPDELNSIIVRLLGKDSEERHRNTEELVAELDSIPFGEASARDEAAEEPGTKRPSAGVMIPLCALLVLIATLWSVQQGFGLSGVARDYAGQVRQGVESVLDGGNWSVEPSGGEPGATPEPGAGKAPPPADAPAAREPAAGDRAQPGETTRQEPPEKDSSDGRGPAESANSPEDPSHSAPKPDKPPQEEDVAEPSAGRSPAGEAPAGERGGSSGESGSPGGGSGRSAGSGGEDEAVYVPDLAGQTVEMARSTLESTGLRVSGVVEEPAAAPSGVVLRTDPPAGSALASGSGVTIVASSGPAESGGATSGGGTGGDGPGGDGEEATGGSDGGSGEGGAPDDEELVTVPDVSGRQSEQAVMILESAGLRAEVRGAFGGEDSGTVVSMDPPAGSRVEEGTLVTLTVMDESPPAVAAEPEDPVEDQYPDQYEEDQPAP